LTKLDMGCGIAFPSVSGFDENAIPCPISNFGNSAQSKAGIGSY
jgi:hypothetical protein